eukprot:Awhi_evm7s5220
MTTIKTAEERKAWSAFYRTHTLLTKEQDENRDRRFLNDIDDVREEFKGEKEEVILIQEKNRKNGLKGGIKYLKNHFKINE